MIEFECKNILSLIQLLYSDICHINFMTFCLLKMLDIYIIVHIIDIMKKLTYKQANEITNKYGYSVYKHGKNDPYLFPSEDSDSPMLREDSLNTYTLDVWNAEELENLLIHRIHEAIKYNHGKFCNSLEL